MLVSARKFKADMPPSVQLAKEDGVAALSQEFAEEARGFGTSVRWWHSSLRKQRDTHTNPWIGDATMFEA